MNYNNDAIETAVEKAKELEEMNWQEAMEMDVLEVKVTAGIDGTLREIHVVTTIGGPHVEINVNAQTVYCNWGDNHTTHFNNDEVSEALWERFSHNWEAATPEA